MSIISHLFNATAEKITVAKDEYNDYSYTSTGSTVSCYFREASRLDEAGTNRENEVSDAVPQIWFDPGVDTQEGDVWLVHGDEDTYWRIKSIVKARKAGNSAVQFLKCDTERHWVIS